MCVNSFPCEKILFERKNYCELKKPAKVILPNKADNIVEFRNYNNLTKVPFVKYADFENLIKSFIK